MHWHMLGSGQGKPLGSLSTGDPLTAVLSQDLLLYQPPSEAAPPTLALPLIVVVSEAALKANANPAPPPGLSAEGLDRLLGAKRECAAVGKAFTGV